MTRASRLLLLVLVGCWSIYPGVTAAEETPELSLRIELRPGPPVGQTPKAAAEGTSPQSVFHEGQPVDVAFIITNKGTRPYRYFDRDYDRSGRMPEYAVEVTDAEGRVLDDPRALVAVGLGGGLGQMSDLAPETSFTKHVYLNQWVMPLLPGKYTVRGIYEPGPNAVMSFQVEIEVIQAPDMPGYIAALAKDAQGEAGDRRVQAMQYLGFTGSALALPHIVAGLYGERQDNRGFQAREGLLYQRDAEARKEALLDALDHKGLTEGLTFYLQRYGVPLERTFPVVTKALDSPDARQRQLAAGVISSYRELGEPALAALGRALSDDNPTVRSAAVGHLYVYRTPEALQALLKTMKDVDEEVRLTAVWASYNFPDELKNEALRQRLAEMLTETPRIAHDILSYPFSRVLAVEGLRKGLDATDPMVRLHTSTVLFALGDDTRREGIADALEAAAPEDQDKVCNWLGSAVQERKLTTPQWGQDWRQRASSWVEWLRQKKQ